MISEEDTQTLQGGEQVLLFVGTQEGKMLTYKVASTGQQKLTQTRGGLFYGPVTAIDLCGTDKVICGSASGEIVSIDILSSTSTEEAHDEALGELNA